MSLQPGGRMTYIVGLLSFVLLFALGVGAAFIVTSL